MFAGENGDKAFVEHDIAFQKDIAAGIADGTSHGTGTGLRGTVKVTVTVSGGEITKISVDSYQDDQEYFEYG